MSHKNMNDMDQQELGGYKEGARHTLTNFPQTVMSAFKVGTLMLLVQNYSSHSSQ